LKRIYFGRISMFVCLGKFIRVFLWRREGVGVHLFHKLREWGFICNNEQQLIVANAKSYAINSYRTRPSICHIIYPLGGSGRRYPIPSGGKRIKPCTIYRGAPAQR